jgi:hypothetical protein
MYIGRKGKGGWKCENGRVLAVSTKEEEKEVGEAGAREEDQEE